MMSEGVTDYKKESLDALSVTYESYDHIPLVEQQSTVTISLTVSDGSLVPVASSVVKCHLTPPDRTPPIQCSVYRRSLSSGQYDVVFTPLIRGLHQLHITVDDRTIPGSPVSVPVTVPPVMRGIPIMTTTELKAPSGIAVTDDGLMVVSEAHGHCITILDKEGKKVRSFGSYGADKGELCGPQGVTIAKRIILVVDCGRHRVDGHCITTVMNKEWNGIRSLGSQSHKKAGQLHYPHGDTIRKSRETILVADCDNHRIQEFTMEGDCISCVGAYGDGPLQFFHPRGITINKTTGQVFVADTSNHRIQVLHPDLTFSHVFGIKSLLERGKFFFPLDVAFDSKGFLYAADYLGHQVKKFTAEGQFVSSFGTEGFQLDRLYYPSGIAVDDNDLLYVRDNCTDYYAKVFTTTGQHVTTIVKEEGPHIRDPFNGIAFTNDGQLFYCSQFDRIFALRLRY